MSEFIKKIYWWNLVLKFWFFNFINFSNSLLICSANSIGERSATLNIPLLRFQKHRQTFFENSTLNFKSFCFKVSIIFLEINFSNIEIIFWEILEKHLKIINVKVFFYVLMANCLSYQKYNHKRYICFIFIFI